jgi:hypothetical protein
MVIITGDILYKIEIVIKVHRVSIMMSVHVEMFDEESYVKYKTYNCDKGVDVFWSNNGVAYDNTGSADDLVDKMISNMKESSREAYISKIDAYISKIAAYSRHYHMGDKVIISNTNEPVILYKLHDDFLIQIIPDNLIEFMESDREIPSQIKKDVIGVWDASNDKMVDMLTYMYKYTQTTNDYIENLTDRLNEYDKWYSDDKEHRDDVKSIPQSKKKRIETCKCLDGSSSDDPTDEPVDSGEWDHDTSDDPSVSELDDESDSEEVVASPNRKDEHRKIFRCFVSAMDKVLFPDEIDELDEVSYDSDEPEYSGKYDFDDIVKPTIFDKTQYILSIAIMSYQLYALYYLITY